MPSSLAPGAETGGLFGNPVIANPRRAGLLCVILAGLFLIVGWWPFSPFPPNRVSWLIGRHGLTFQPYGLAYTEAPLRSTLARHPDRSRPGLTVEISLESTGEPSRGVSHILTIDNDRTPSTLVLGQWRSELLLRIPASTTRRGFREVGVDSLRPRQPRVVIISGDSSGTTFYVDGQFVERMANFVLPPGSLDGRLILGDAATGQQTWSGTVFGLALLDRAIDAHEAAAHQSLWLKDGPSALGDDPGLVALYPFDEGAGQVARDLSKNPHALNIPGGYVVLRKTMLKFPGIGFPIGPSMLGDVALNLLGFVPLGFLAFHARRRAACTWVQRATFATLVGTALSLTIEVGQVWLPTRSSTTADLVCNTAGALVGVAVATWISRRRDGNGMHRERVGVAGEDDARAMARGRRS